MRDSIFSPSSYLSFKLWNFIGTAFTNLLVYLLIVVFLLPLGYVITTSLKSESQLMDGRSPEWPARAEVFNYQGTDYELYDVPTDAGLMRWALMKGKPNESLFVDPTNPDAGIITWQGKWQGLEKIYDFHLNFENFWTLWQQVPFTVLIRNSAMIGIISGVGALFSSISVAYGLSRFNIPGERIILLLVVGTLLIPEKITLIPTYFTYIVILKWGGTLLPLILPHLFGNAAFIFLLRQNFKSIPRDMDEAAMLDGAGPLRILVSIILPQSYPAVITVGLLHFFYIWNETRQTSLYLGTTPALQTVVYGIQNYQSRFPIEHLLQASGIIVMALPVIVLLFTQRVFMRELVVTGLEK